MRNPECFHMHHQTLFPANVLIFLLFFVIHLPVHVIHINHHSNRPASAEVQEKHSPETPRSVTPTPCCLSRPDLPSCTGGHCCTELIIKAGSSISHKAPPKKAVTRPSVPTYFCRSDFGESLPCTTGTLWYGCWVWKRPQNKGRTAAASSGAQSLSGCPRLTSAYHTHKVHLRLQRWTETYVLIETSSVKTWEIFFDSFDFLHAALLLLSLYHELHPPALLAKGGSIVWVKLAARSSLTSFQNGININTVFGFSVYCWYGRILKSNFHSLKALF